MNDRSTYSSGTAAGKPGFPFATNLFIKENKKGLELQYKTIGVFTATVNRRAVKRNEPL